MNGFLVTARCAIDDLPLALFADRAAAEAFGRGLTEADCIKTAREVFGLDTSIFHAVDVVEFRDGRPLGWIDVKCFDDEAPIKLHTES